MDSRPLRKSTAHLSIKRFLGDHVMQHQRGLLADKHLCLIFFFFRFRKQSEREDEEGKEEYARSTGLGL